MNVTREVGSLYELKANFALKGICIREVWCICDWNDFPALRGMILIVSHTLYVPAVFRGFEMSKQAWRRKRVIGREEENCA